MKIFIDPGHGGQDPGAVSINGRPEKETNLRVSVLVAAILKAHGADVLLSRDNGCQTVSLEDRVSAANSYKADVFVSLHADSAPGSKAKGHHAIYSASWQGKPGQGGNGLARLLIDEVTQATGRSFFPRSDSNRGAWVRTDSQGQDYYYVIRKTQMPAVILERGFLSNPEDEALLFQDTFLEKQALGIAKGILKYQGIDLETPTAKTPIVGAAQATEQQGRAWAKKRKATNDFMTLAELYWYLGKQTGIRPEVAYAQAAKETAFGRFGGVIDRSFNNWCGLKTSTGGSNSDPSAHHRFQNDHTGVLAHMQHLAVYAGKTVTGPIVDPRYHLVKEGSAPTVEDLGGRWAPAQDYGVSIVRDYLNGLLDAPDEAPEDSQLQIIALQNRIKLLENTLQDIKTFVNQKVTEADIANS